MFDNANKPMGTMTATSVSSGEMFGNANKPMETMTAMSGRERRKAEREARLRKKAEADQQSLIDSPPEVNQPNIQHTKKSERMKSKTVDMLPSMKGIIAFE